MDILTAAEARSFCQIRGILLTEESEPHTKRSLGAQRILPYNPDGLLNAAHRLAGFERYAATGALDDLGEGFHGCLVWLLDFGFWAEPHERAGQYLFSRASSTATSANELADFPARCFSPSDFVAAESSILTVLIQGWDARVVYGAGNLVAKLSHHRTIGWEVGGSDSDIDAFRSLIEDYPAA